MEIMAGVNQNTFPSDGSPFSIFEPFSFVTGNLTLRGDVSSALSYAINIERDNILQNSVDFRLKTRTDNFRFEFGPFIGFSDNFGTPDAGVLGSFEVTLPGIVFLSFSGMSTIGSKFTFTSNNFREAMGAEFGFWLPFALTTISADTRSFTQYRDDFFDPVRDTLTRFMLSIDFFGKNFPVILRLDGGYQMLSRTYHGFFDRFDELRSFFAGFGLNIRASESLRFMIGGEIPFNLTASQFVNIPEETARLFRLHGGISYSFF